MLCLPLTREVDFCEAKRRRERKRKTTPQSAAADSTPDKGSRQRLTTHLWVTGNRCVAGRPIKSALVRSQYRIGLCPKMKYPPLCGGIFIQAHLMAEDTKTSLVFLKANQRFSRCISTIPQGNAYYQNEVFGKVAQIQSKYKF